MKVVFAGTPQFAVPSLEHLLASKHEIMAVYTQPDRPAGRGRKLTASPVKQLAQEHGITIYQPRTLRDAEAQQQLRDLVPDVMVVVAYGLLLPQAVLDIPMHGCVNVHPSLLPRWRGAAPIQHTLLAGDKQTGVATMLLDAGMDTGPILMMEKTQVKPGETSAKLHDRLAELGGNLLVETLDGLDSRSITPSPQSNNGATHAGKLQKSDAIIDWNKSAQVLQQQICAFNPWPVAQTIFEGDVLRIWEAEAIACSHNADPGTVVDIKDGVDVATDNGFLRILRLQLPGSKPVSAQDFINRFGKVIIPNKTKLGVLGEG